MTTKVNNRMIDGAAVNILDFGAVGDGVTDDTAAIQAALDFCRDNVGYETCEVPPSPNGSSYIFTTLKVYTQTTFKGTGGVLKYADNTVTDANQSYYPIHNLGEDRVVYDGLIVEGNSANNPQPVVCDVITAVGFRTEVVNCKIFNAVDSSIIFSAVQRGRCQNNYFEGARDVNIYINASSGTLIDDSIISGNICKDGVYGGIAVKREVENIVISNNTIVNCGNGITVEDFGGDLFPKNIQILDNELRNIGYPYRGADNLAERGISVSRLTNGIIAGNKIYQCSGDCILLANTTNVVVEGNHIVGYTASPAATGNAGIINSSTPTVACVIADNHISDVDDQGIYLGGPERSSITGNNITSNGSALRLNASTRSTIAHHNILNGGTLDYEVFAGADVVNSLNISVNATTDVGRNGFRTVSAGQPLPPSGTLVPFFAGEEVMHLAANQWFKAYGTSAGEWSPL